MTSNSRNRTLRSLTRGQPPLSPPPSPGAPHPRFPVEFRGFPELHAPLLKERRTRGPVQSCVQEIRGISLVFREMWDPVRTSVRGPKTMGEALRQPFVPDPTICHLAPDRSRSGEICGLPYRDRLFLLTIWTPVSGASTRTLTAHEDGRTATAA